MVKSEDYCTTPVVQETWLIYYTFALQVLHSIIIISFGYYTLVRNEKILGAASKKIIYFHFVCTVCKTILAFWPLFFRNPVWTDDLGKKSSLSGSL